MTARKENLGASVAARLLNRAREQGDEFQNVLASFCFERFLYRLGVSALRDRFVLKGAMLLRTWSDRRYRATQDLDLRHVFPYPASGFVDMTRAPVLRLTTN